VRDRIRRHCVGGGLEQRDELALTGCDAERAIFGVFQREPGRVTLAEPGRIDEWLCERQPCGKRQRAVVPLLLAARVGLGFAVAVCARQQRGTAEQLRVGELDSAALAVRQSVSCGFAVK